MSRVTAGTAKGRLLRSPNSLVIRPTPAKVREALFSILGPDLPDARVLDLYCGIGGLGIEALSRGAATCTFVDRERQALHYVRENLAITGFADRAHYAQRRIPGQLEGLHGGPFDLVLSDPPYADDGLAQLAKKLLALAPTLLAPNVLWAHELPGRAMRPEPPEVKGWELITARRYGDTGIVVLALPQAEP